MKAIKKQGGFTLVEIAIVLVIIGLLLAGVLKGQEMIENGRVKSAATDLNGVAAAYNSYLDRYKALPGDDGPTATIQLRGGNWTTMPGGTPNGIIVAAAAQTFNPAAGAEDELFFRHLRAAGYLTGDPTATGVNALPLNAWGGRVGIVNVASIEGRPAVARLLVCMGNVPGRSASALDVQLDDRLPGTGDFRATLGANNAAPTAAVVAAYVDDQVYTVCRNL